MMAVSQLRYWFTVSVVIFILTMLLALAYYGYNYNSYTAPTSNLLDLRLAITLIVVEVPLGLGIAWLVPILFERRGKVIEKRMTDRYDELKGYLKKHSEEDILPVLKRWTVDSAPSTIFGGLRYTVLSVSAYYAPKRQSSIGKLTEPNTSNPNILADITEHLSKGVPGDWRKWNGLKIEVASHLGKVVDEWNRIEDATRTECQELGLVEWDGTGQEPLERCTMTRIVETLWVDSDPSRGSGKHVWDIDPIPKEPRLWVKPDGSGSREDVHRLLDLAASRNAETLKGLMRFLNSEGIEVRTTRENLAIESTAIEKEGQEFRTSLVAVADAYERLHVPVPASCSTCGRWLVELKSLGGA